ncbi:MAG: c-type cytochrome [Pirellulaceae bacterium]|nr:c-type cytochrome [Pirellulaceae bacterium]
MAPQSFIRTPYLSTAFAFLLVMSCQLSGFSTTRADDQIPIRVLIVDGRNNHAWAGTTTAVRQMLGQTGCFDVDVSTAPIRYAKSFPQRPRDATAEQTEQYEAQVAQWRSEEKKYEASIEKQWDGWRPPFGDYDVVIDNYNGPNWQTPVKADLVQFVQAGGGLIVLHAANNCFSDWDEFNRMLGLGWRKKHQGVRVTVDDTTGKLLHQNVGEGPDSGHGSKHPFVVKTRATAHPIMRGLPSEWLHGRDELYHAMRGPAKGVEVLATAFSAPSQRGTGEHEPIIWTTRFGRGRVVTNTMGHYWVGGGGATMRHSLHCVGFQTILNRSCQWAAGREVTIDVPEAFPDADRVSIVHPEELGWTIRSATPRNSDRAIMDVQQRVTAKKARNPYALLSPDESVATLKLPPGYRVEVVLSEPHIREPVLSVWDANGRMYVAQMRSYMQDEYGTGTKTLRNGRISRHEDTDGDGVLDRHTVFVDGLNLPRMMLPLDDRLAVVETDTTDIYSYRDTTGDGIADEKTLLYTGSRKIDATRSVEHQDSGLVWAIDNWIYLSRGRERYRFTDGSWNVEKIEFDWNQWGLDQDDTGRLFFNANSEPLKSFQQHPIYWSQIASRAKGRWRKPTLGGDYPPEFLNMFSTCRYGDRGEDHAYRSFTSATGGSVYRGDALPPEIRGDYFVCDPTGHLVRRSKLQREAGKIVVSHPYQATQSEFIVSDDINFRPVATHTGPDGCLYVVDMYRGMIQDAPWVNDGMKAFLRRTGLNFNIHHGRILRVVHEDHSVKPPLAMLDMTTAQLVDQLENENGWVRDTAQKLILLRDDRSRVEEQLVQAVRSHENPLARLHALWTLEGCGAADSALLVKTLEDSDWRVREAALRVSEPLIRSGDETIWTALPRLARDDNPNVARQFILSLGWDINERSIELIDQVIARHLTNEVVYLSAMTALYDRETPMIAKIRNGSAFRTIKDPALKLNTQRRWNLGIANWKQESAPARPLDDEAIALVENGYQIYAQLCVNCHGDNGRGMQLPGQPSKAPALAGSPRVTGQKEVLTRILLHGLTGPVDGKSYREVMAPSDQKDDQWIASVASYIRQEWGNLASIIRPSDVAAIRAANKSRYRAWTLEELQQFSLPELADRSFWRVSSSSGPDSAARAINGKSDSCDNPNQPGRWFQVDLGQPHTLTSLVLTSSTPDRYPRQYELLVSSDGQQWGEPVASGMGEGAINMISMEPTLGQFFRIVQTGSDAHHRWSLTDLQIFGVAGEPELAVASEDEGPLPTIDELVLLSGNADQGSAVFKKSCSQCHQINGVGINFGPELSKVADRLKKADLLQSILNPDAVVDKKYHGEMIVTDEGQVFTGFVVSETESKLSIRLANNQVRNLSLDEIHDRRRMTTSFMPSGLERTMTQQQLLDLIEYLQTCR